jgi:hypothetical protein
MLARPVIASFMAILLLSPVSSSFNFPLSDQAVREAYFLGQHHDEKLEQFFQAYRHYLHTPQSGPDVHMIELLTPYALAVDVSRKHAPGYSAQQAQQDYLDHGNILRLAVYVRYTPSYGAGANSAPSNRNSPTWKDFQFRLTQSGQTIKSRGIRYEATQIGGGGKAGGPRRTGFVAYIEYNAQNVASADASAEIDTPDGQHLVSSFDLASLR